MHMLALPVDVLRLICSLAAAGSSLALGQVCHALTPHVRARNRRHVACMRWRMEQLEQEVLDAPFWLFHLVHNHGYRWWG